MTLQAMSALWAVPALWGSARRFDYQAQDCPPTLRQAADEYRQEHPEALQADKLGAESTALFRSHHICHVIFGLDTTVRDEVLADFWTNLWHPHLSEIPALPVRDARGEGIPSCDWLSQGNALDHPGRPADRQGTAAKYAHVQEPALGCARVLVDATAEHVTPGI